MKQYNKHIIIVGTARSGTSWLSEIIATRPRYRMLFEPEHEHRTSKGILLCDRLMRNEQEAGREANHYLKQVFANKVDCDWIAQLSNRKWKRHLWPFIPKKFIIKFVRCNLSAKFMNEYYGIPVVHVLRHPYKVIFSQQRVKFPWLYDLSHFAKQNDVVELVKQHSGIDLKQINHYSEVELLALRWAIENCIPLEVLGGYGDNALVIKHEEISKNISLFYDLCKRFNIEPKDNIEATYKRPSSKTHAKSYINSDKEESLELSNTEKLQVQSIIQAFGSKLYDL